MGWILIVLAEWNFYILSLSSEYYKPLRPPPVFPSDRWKNSTALRMSKPYPVKCKFNSQMGNWVPDCKSQAAMEWTADQLCFFLCFFLPSSMLQGRMSPMSPNWQRRIRIPYSQSNVSLWYHTNSWETEHGKGVWSLQTWAWEELQNSYLFKTRSHFDGQVEKKKDTDLIFLFFTRYMFFFKKFF